MSTIKILVQGYAKEIDGKEFASSTATLIQDNNFNIIVDPGMDRKALLEALKEQNLTPSDINFVILTHTHPDHMLLTGIFEKAKVLDDTSIYSYNGNIDDHEGKVPGTNIQILKTPGHDQFHCAVLLDTEEYGKVAIAADVFWWSDDEEQNLDKDSLLNKDDPYMKDKEKLLESRKKLLDLADYIIPGHGKMFKVEKI
ncbi:MBL fold metallo-hydrolase [Candidatus Woesearchaeota archaeon]|nr:MBL fold metallo-hydrolase [Candidatus Woesearchaeota archaeon]MBW3021617.1 MBL fold metallo-hydrolase [Candidatus Woesearchaeota archaeon]